MCRHSHDSSSSVRSKYIVTDPNRNLDGLIQRMSSVSSGKDTRFLFGRCSIQIRPTLCRLHIFKHLFFPFVCRDFLDQWMFGCERHVGDTHEGVGSSCENGNLFVAFDGKVDAAAYRLANPLLLGCERPGRPVQPFEPVQQTVCIVRNFQNPLTQWQALDWIRATFRQPINHFLVCQDGSQSRAPIDRNLRLFGQSLVEELQKYPLCPFDIINVGCCDFAIPIIGESQHLQLSFEIGNIAGRCLRRLRSRLDGKLFCRQAKGIPTNRMQDIEPFHAPVASHDVTRCVSFGVTDMQAGT
mmetsp:Transcript_24890/g.68953  ORF Transcript_24890/g.68953 Transcript_24890/m.68953 type:complete len:298 (-) Transcript_24890:510-1403(-)